MPQIDKDKLNQLYIEQNKQPKEIATILNCSVGQINNALVKYKIPRKKPKCYVTPVVGEKFHRWSFIAEIRTHCNKIKWKCKCECGKTKILDYCSIKNGISKSCGCYHHDKMHDICWKGYGEISGTYWGITKTSAKKRNHEFTITIEYAWDLFLKQKRLCALTGIKLVFAKDIHDVKLKNQTASIDRIDSKKGYIEGNVQWVFRKINYMKNILGQKEFIYLCKKVAKYHEN